MFKYQVSVGVSWKIPWRLLQGFLEKYGYLHQDNHIHNAAEVKTAVRYGTTVSQITLITFELSPSPSCNTILCPTRYCSSTLRFFSLCPLHVSPDILHLATLSLSHYFTTSPSDLNSTKEAWSSVFPQRACCPVEQNIYVGPKTEVVI